MTTKAHREKVYQTKAVDEVSWYRPHLDLSLKLIQDAAPDTAARSSMWAAGRVWSMISSRGYDDVTVLDIS